MTSAEMLIAIVGAPVNSEAVRTLIASDRLDKSSEADLQEGLPVRTFWSGHSQGYSLTCQNGRVSSAFIFVVVPKLDPGYMPFSAPLPGGLLASDARPVVRSRFGTPERSGEAFTHPTLGRQGSWDRFLVGRLLLHFQYVEPEERIGMLTIMAAETAP